MTDPQRVARVLMGLCCKDCREFSTYGLEMDKNRLGQCKVWNQSTSGDDPCCYQFQHIEEDA